MNILPGRILPSMALVAGSLLASASAKPIAFADGTTVMAEYGAGTMTEIQAFYAPTFRYSVGGGHLSLNSDVDDSTRDITYARCARISTKQARTAIASTRFSWVSHPTSTAMKRSPYGSSCRHGTTRAVFSMERNGRP
jgi:hypothetical protein